MHLPHAAEAFRKSLVEKVRYREFIEADIVYLRKLYLVPLVELLDREIADLRRSLKEFEGDDGCDGA